LKLFKTGSLLDDAPVDKADVFHGGTECCSSINAPIGADHYLQALRFCSMASA
jgi:hypothetical protein